MVPAPDLCETRKGHARPDGRRPEPVDEMDQYARDSDGSAKVALIGIDRSIAAWGMIRNRFPDHNGSVRALLIHLGQLRKEVENAFPEARGVIRPGFDMVYLNG